MATRIRCACAADDLAVLLHAPAAAFYDSYFGDRTRALAALARIAPEPGHTVALDIALVAIDAHGVVGVMTAYPAVEGWARALRFAQLTAEHETVSNRRRMARLLSVTAELEPPVPADSLYVDSLAVAPRGRRRGIARQLLARAERLGLDAGCAELALDTGLENHGARALYAGLGMRPGATVIATADAARAGLLDRGWIAYTKPLVPPSARPGPHLPQG